MQGGEDEFFARRELLLYGERLVFVLDDSSEEGLEAWDEGKNRLEAAADAIRLIIRRKQNATVKHTFAIASYNSLSLVKWNEGFTADYQLLDEALSSMISTSINRQLQNTTQYEETAGVRLSDIFSQLMEFVSRNDGAVSRTKVPVYTSTQPFFSAPANKTNFIDVLFLHHKLAAHRECASSCQETLNVLSALQRGDPEEDDCAGDEENNYLFETHPSNMRLMTYAALLCSHSAHREEQTEMLNKMNLNSESLRDIRQVDEQSRMEEITARTNSATQTKNTSATVTVSSSTPSGASTGVSPPLPPHSKNFGNVAADTVKNMFGMNFNNKNK